MDVDSNDKGQVTPEEGKTSQFKKGRFGILFYIFQWEYHTSQGEGFKKSRFGILFGVGILLSLAADPVFKITIDPLISWMLETELITEWTMSHTIKTFSIFVFVKIFLFILPWGSYITSYMVKKYRLGPRRDILKFSILKKYATTITWIGVAAVFCVYMAWNPTWP